MGYKAIEEALSQRILFTMAAYVDETTVVKSSVDRLFTALQEGQKDYGCLIDYAGGHRLEEAPFNGKMWRWIITGAFLMRYNGDDAAIEAAARDFVDATFAILDGDHTLGSTCGVARLETISPPQPASINDVPFYWLLFEIEALEKI